MKPRWPTRTWVRSRPVISEFGLRPTETRTLSKTFSRSFTSLPSKHTRMPFASSFTAVTVVFSRMESKTFSRRLWSGKTKSRSAPGSKPGVISTTETFDPSAAYTVPNSRPIYPPPITSSVPGASLRSSAEVDLKDAPGTLLVIGGGYIGLELGTVYAALGSKVSVVEMTPGLLPGADRDLVLPLHKRLEKAFDSILLNTTVTAVKEEANGIRVCFDGKDVKDREKVFDKVLVSVGRRANSEISGLDGTQVRVGQRGFIQANKHLQTDDPSIYAIGDVIGEPMLAHKASHEGRTAAEHIAGHKVAFEPNAIPAVVFTDPEIAWAGVTETQAEIEGREIKVAKFPWAASGRAMTLDRTEGMTKLILDPASERVLGVGIVGVGAGDMIAEGAMAIEMSALAKDVALTIHPHPTLSETVMQAAEVFFGTSTDLYRPKRHPG